MYWCDFDSTGTRNTSRLIYDINSAMKTINKRTGICESVDRNISTIIDTDTNERIILRNHQLEKFGSLPPHIRQNNGLKPGVTVHYVSIKDENTQKVMFYIDGDYYFPKEAWCAGAESITREHKQYFQFVRPEEIIQDERSRNPGFYNHLRFLTSMANIREEGEIYLGTDNYGYAIGLDDQLSESQIPDAEACLRNYIRLSTGSALFEASLRIEWLRKVGRDGQTKLICHIVVPQWKGEVPVFCNGEAVYIRSGAASVRLKYNDLKSYIINPETFINHIK